MGNNQLTKAARATSEDAARLQQVALFECSCCTLQATWLGSSEQRGGSERRAAKGKRKEKKVARAAVRRCRWVGGSDLFGRLAEVRLGVMVRLM